MQVSQSCSFTTTKIKAVDVYSTNVTSLPCVYLRPSYCLYTGRHGCASVYVITPLPYPRRDPSFALPGLSWLTRSFIRHSQTLLRVSLEPVKFLVLFCTVIVIKLPFTMLKEKSRYEHRQNAEQEGRPLTSSRLPAIDELTLGLKQKLHLQARARAAPYYIRKQEPVDLVERLLEQRALVAEAVRRLQEKKQPCHEISVDS